MIDHLPPARESMDPAPLAQASTQHITVKLDGEWHLVDPLSAEADAARESPTIPAAELLARISRPKPDFTRAELRCLYSVLDEIEGRMSVEMESAWSKLAEYFK